MNLSIKNVPDDLAEKLRERAKRHHRTPQGEIMTILEDATGGTARRAGSASGLGTSPRDGFGNCEMPARVRAVSEGHPSSFFRKDRQRGLAPLHTLFLILILQLGWSHLRL